MGDWEPQEKTSNIEASATENKILGHIINRLQDMCYPVQPGAPKPIFPVFPLKAIVLGKPFAGKTSALKNVQQGRKKHDFFLMNHYNLHF